MHAEFQLDSLKGRFHSKDLVVSETIILKWISGKSGLGVWIGFI